MNDDVKIIQKNIKKISKSTCYFISMCYTGIRIKGMFFDIGYRHCGGKRKAIVVGTITA